MMKGLLPVAIMLSLCCTARAAVIRVPADQPTIQAGIDAATHGDTVLVTPGTYVENLSFKGKAITVTSSGGPLWTVVDGGNPSSSYDGSVVTFDSGEGPGSVLEESSACTPC